MIAVGRKLPVARTHISFYPAAPSFRLLQVGLASRSHARSFHQVSFWWAHRGCSLWCRRHHQGSSSSIGCPCCFQASLISKRCLQKSWSAFSQTLSDNGLNVSLSASVQQCFPANLFCGVRSINPTKTSRVYVCFRKPDNPLVLVLFQNQIGTLNSSFSSCFSIIFRYFHLCATCESKLH